MNDIWREILILSYEHKVHIDIRFDGRTVDIFMQTELGLSISKQISPDLLHVDNIDIVKQTLYDMFEALGKRTKQQQMQDYYERMNYTSPVIDDGYLGKVGGANDRSNL